jgi:cytochrome c-type biogenesis protein CcmH
MIATRIFAVALVLSFALPSLVRAQAQTERPPEGDGPYERPPAAVEAIRQLRSPYCPGMMLEVCSSSQGAALRDSIEQLAEEGWEADAIVEWMIGNHGEEYRALPPGEGAGLLAWLMPPAGILLGAVILGLAFARMKRRQRDAPLPATEDLSPEDEERLAQALRELEKEEEAPFL